MINGRAVQHAVAGVGILVLLGAVAVVVQYCTGCANPADKALNAVEVAEWTLPYQFALDACKDEAKKRPRAQQWEAYQQCEDRETYKVCEKRPSLKGSWKRCAEVMP
jgi:hypothetical protein